MFNRGNRLALRYALSRTHLLEKHVNALYAFMKLRYPEESDFFDDLLGDWQADVGRMQFLVEPARTPPVKTCVG